MRGGRGLGGGGRLVRRAKVKLERAGPGFGAPPAPGLACEKIAALAGAGGGRRSWRRCPSAAWRLRPPVAPRHRAVIGPRRPLPAEEVPAESGLAPRPPKLSPPRPGISAQGSVPRDQRPAISAQRPWRSGRRARAWTLAHRCSLTQRSGGVGGPRQPSGPWGLGVIPDRSSATGATKACSFISFPRSATMVGGNSGGRWPTGRARSAR